MTYTGLPNPSSTSSSSSSSALSSASSSASSNTSSIENRNVMEFPGVLPDAFPEDDQENSSHTNQLNYSMRNSNNQFWIGRTHRFQVNDVIDVLDSSNHWCEAEILKIDHQNQQIYVTYLYWNNKFDEWVQDVDDRTAPFHTHTYYEGGPIKPGQRVEVMDETQKWRHAYIIELEENMVKVHYHGYHHKFDAWVNIAENKIRPFGKYSNNNAKKYPKNKLWRIPVSNVYEEQKDNSSSSSSTASMKLDNQMDGKMAFNNSNNNNDNNNNTNSNIVTDGRTRQIRAASNQYNHYLNTLATQRLRIVEVLGDGNCLFRSVAHQIYGDNELHWLVRQKCMDYMEADADFFSQFVEGGRESFAMYLRAKRTNACWGDDPEIQAISEIYHRPAEIWAYDPVSGARKLRTFHEAATDSLRSAGSHLQPSIRLSYYGGGHYDSIVDEQFMSTIIRRRPGEVEDMALALVKHRLTHVTSNNSSSSNNNTNNNAIDEAIGMSDAERIERDTINLTIEMSRKDLYWAEEDIESTLAITLEEEANRVGIITKAVEGENMNSSSASGGSRSSNNNNHNNNDNDNNNNTHDIIATQKEILSKVTETSENEYIEKAIISSLQDDPAVTEAQLIQQIQRESAAQHGIIHIGMDIDTDMIESASDPELVKVLELSKLSEEEALELALQQSMNSSHSILPSTILSSSGSGSSSSSVIANAYPESNAIKAPAHVNSTATTSKMNTNAATIDEYIDDEEMLHTALAVSMAESNYGHTNISSIPYNPSAFGGYEINDDDEDISRAIAESLRR